MPEEIETQLEPQGMADLLSYLQSNIGNERQIFNAWRKDQILGELKKSILARFSYGIFKKFTCISIAILFKSTIPDSCKSKQTGPIMLECSNARMLECSNARKRRELACTFIVLPTWLRSKLR